MTTSASKRSTRYPSRRSRAPVPALETAARINDPAARYRAPHPSQSPGFSDSTCSLAAVPHHDFASSLFLGTGPLRLTGHYQRSLRGGDALQQALVRRLVEYRLLVFERT
jgi:hypothetical protein